MHPRRLSAPVVVLTSMIAAAVVPVTANGAVIVQNVSWDLSYELRLTQSTVETLVISRGVSSQLKQFDPGLGTLTKVDYLLITEPAPYWNDQFFVRNLSSQAVGGYFGAFSKWFVPTTPGFGTAGYAWGNGRPFSLDPLQDWTLIFTGDITNGAPAPEHLPLFPMTVPNPALFTDSFIGTGTFDFDPWWEIGLVASIDSGVEFRFRKSWAATYQLIYTFTPAETPVPEPGTLALLSLGFAGLVFTCRRKQ